MVHQQSKGVWMHLLLNNHFRVIKLHELIHGADPNWCPLTVVIVEGMTKLNVQHDGVSMSDSFSGDIRNRNVFRPIGKVISAGSSAMADS